MDCGIPPASAAGLNVPELLKLEHISLEFGGVRALDQVSLSVSAGQIYGLIGPNGAGKTSLFNVMTGLYPPAQGMVWFKGQSLLDLPAQEIARRGIARTFQNIRLFEEMSLIENVMVGMHTHLTYRFIDLLIRSHTFKHSEKQARSHALSLLERVGLAQHSAVLAGNLSYGNQRKLEIARALAMQPQLLLLDEPVAGMNPAEKNDIMQLIQSLRTEHLTLLLIEHDMRFVMELCDSLSVLDFGRVIAQGSPQEIQSNRAVIAAYLGEEEQNV